VDGGGEAFEHREDRRERVLDGAEPTLDGGLVRRCSFALRRVLDADRVVGALGSLGHVRRALVGDELGAGEPGCGIGSDALDELSALALVHGERSEQVAFAVADVLDTDESVSEGADEQRLMPPPRVVVVAARRLLHSG
jgi:hypothetical protein